jgi:hypothetical protein
MMPLRMHLLMIVACSFFIGHLAMREDLLSGFFLIANMAGVAINTQCILVRFRNLTGEDYDVSG